MEVSAHIDWISFTAKNRGMANAGVGTLRKTIARHFPLNIGSLDWIQARANNGYTVAMKSETGILAMVHPDRPDMGIHVVMSGQTLARNEEIGIVSTELLDWCIKNEHSLTRIDYAVDAKDTGLNIDDLTQDLKDGKAKTRARSAPLWDETIKKGKTQNVGSVKNRTKLLSIYDKSVELGITADWIRAELKLYGQHANNSASIVQNQPNLAKTIQALIKGYCDFPDNEVWQQIMGTDEIWLSVPEVKEGNTELWLLNQCAPALAKILDLDEGFMYRFMVAVSENRTGTINLNDDESE